MRPSRLAPPPSHSGAMPLAAPILALVILALAGGPANAHGGRVSAVPPVPVTANPHAATAAPRIARPAAFAATPAVARRRGTTTERRLSWEDWWNHNRDALLGFEAPIHREKPATKAGRAQGNAPIRSGASGIRTLIVPALDKATRDPHAEVRAAAFIALGKTGFANLSQAVAVGLQDKNAKVREAAALGLGMLPGEDAIKTLAGVALGARGGRHLRTRAFAALSLGFQSDPAAIDVLRKVLARKERAHDVPAAAMLALGSIGGADVAAPLLRALSPRTKLPAEVRAFAAIALGKLGARDGLSALVEALGDNSIDVRTSAALALGGFRPPSSQANRELKEIRARLGDPMNALSARARTVLVKRADELERRAKTEAVRVERRHTALLKRLHAYALGHGSRGNLAARNFAAVSLGRLGGQAAVNALADVLRKAKPTELRGFCCVALGLAARDTDPSTSDRVRRLLLDMHVGSKAAETRGASAIGLGLLGQRDAGALLLKSLDRAKDEVVRGHLALAMGMLRYGAASDKLRQIVKYETNADLRRNAALALGLIGDAGAVDVLIGVLRRANGRLLQASAAVALGRIGNSRAIPVLIDLLTAEKTPSLSRAFAAVALGQLSERGPVPRLARLASANNYLVPIGSLLEVFDIL